ncbi:hypothetical protein AALM99_07040 [Lactococcus muris]|uniref:Uncharacterized protein n=1 Tax=Lactococcus muris TaxID=2941330 RepID=A0ABV4DC85_9LACT
MTILEAAEKAINYGKNLSSPGIYLSNCYDILNNKIEETEEDVLKLDESINIFFMQNIEFPITAELKQHYSELKQAHLTNQKYEKKKCTLRYKKKFEQELNSELSSLQYFKENSSKILEVGHLTKKELNSAISKIEGKINRIQDHLDNIENYCQRHGLEVNFENAVIEPMKEYINQKRKESF